MKKMIRNFVGTAVLLSSLYLAGCSDAANEEATSEPEKPVVAVSIVPERTFVEAVAGDSVDIVTLIPPGSNPGNYEPTAQEMEAFSDAALYFSIGVATEEANILPNVGDMEVVPLEDEVAAVYADRTFESGGRDPHIWLSPKRVKVMVEAIARELGELDPDNQELYEQNAADYIAQLDEVDQAIQAALEGVESKQFIVYHPAFGYIAEDYGLTMYALEQDGKEATAQHLQEMVDLAKAENIKVIFYQEEMDSSQAEAFAEEIGGQTIQLAPLAADYIANLENMARTMTEAMQ
nr:zinc ABC transporter substrate-binding protein [uncultured Trichococcus sp.]